MSYPKTVKGTEVCLTVEKGGVYLYGNRQAFRTLAAWISAIAKSRASEHLECHVQSNLSRGGKVMALFDKKTSRLFKKPGTDDGFELTLQIVEPKDLRKLSTLKKPGRVPEGWRSLDLRRVPKAWRAAV